MAFTVTIPLLNANEPEARIAGLAVSEGQFVHTGDELCTLETTKAAQAVQAEAEGFVRGLRFHQGQTVRAGETLCFLASNAEWEPPPAEELPAEAEDRNAARHAAGALRITRPALALAEEHGIDPLLLPQDVLVTRSDVQRMIDRQRTVPPERAPAAPLDPNAVIVYGAGGHGKSVIDLIRSGGIYRIHGIVDDHRPPGEETMGLILLGGAGVLDELHARGIRQAANAVGGIGDIRVRMDVFETLAESGFHCPELIHPSAVVEARTVIGAGIQVFPQAYIGTDASLGFGVIVNTGAIVSHDCRLADYANISPGAILAGGVEIGPGCLIGMGATVNLGVRVGARARVGNGATVKADVPEGGLVPAGTIWPP